MDSLPFIDCDIEWGFRLKNIAASLAILLGVFCFYRLAPFYQVHTLTKLHFFSTRCTTRELLPLLYAGYGLLLLLYYLREQQPKPAKSVHCLLALKRILQNPRRVYTEGLSAEERLGFLSILLKGFFAPLMVPWLLDHTVNMLQNGLYIFTHLHLLRLEFLFVFNKHGFFFLFQTILFLDVLFFTLGYLIELPSLRNTIRSVDTTLLGWSAALLCYPPFNSMTNKILGWQPSNFPQFENPAVHIAINLFLLLLMAIYTSASIALNFKASNLTHRGIIASGPYRFIRHPAYICKNLAWWLATIPAIQAGLHSSSAWSALLVPASMAGWSAIYALRALTEEEHLRKVDGEYAEYCMKVRYRFIPGVL